MNLNPHKTLLIGFDGANPEFVERYLPDLPNFRRLIQGGSWGPMLSTVPVDTPTNWTALVTGATAATSHITGFAFYEPGASLRPDLRPSSDYARLRAAEFLWEAADRQGRRSIVVNYPFAWYSRELERTVIVGGDQISGGASRIMSWGCLATADRLVALEEAREIVLRPTEGGYAAELTFGQQDKLEWSATGLVRTGETIGEATGVVARLRTIPGSPPRLLIHNPAGAEVSRLRPGEWSDYVPLPFGSEEGWVRFLLVELSPQGDSLQLYHTMVTRSDGWTKPGAYAAQLLAEVGPYQQGMETGGMMELKGWLGAPGIEPDCEIIHKTGEILVGYAGLLAERMPDWDQLYIQLHSSDGLNHRRLGHLDPNHPCTTPERTALAEEWMRRNYITTDEILGWAAGLAERNDAVLAVVSDHSAIPTHTWVDTARPFQEMGWLHFDAEGRWDPRSRVRKMINHSIYVNAVGRQPEGVVAPEEYERVRDGIISALLAMRDPRTGECPIAVAARREDLASIGTDDPHFGDVVYLMRPGYTNQPASEGRLLTAEALARFLDEPAAALATGYGFHRSIQGNHHDYLPNAAYPGVCSNRAILLLHGPGIRAGHRIVNARTIDVAPTLAAIAGIEPPAQSEGQVLFDCLA